MLYVYVLLILIYLHFIQKVQLIHRDYLMHYKYVLSCQYLEYPGVTLITY